MTTSEARELRAQIRTWRRGRADARLIDVLGDAYVVVFAALMLGSILVNVVLGVGRLSDTGCTSEACSGARALLPVLVALAVLAAVTTTARLLGPVFVSPAVGTWLLTTPVDRRELLRPRLVVGVVLAGLMGGVITAGGAVLGGWSLAGATTLVGVVALLASATVGAATRAQSLTPTGQTARAVGTAARLPAAALWLGLLAVALGLTEGIVAPRPHRVVVALAVGAAALLAAAASVVGARGLRLLRGRDVSRGGALAPGLSGALSSLDLALAYDVVLEHRWRGHLPVRSRRARRGPRFGPAALVRADVARLTRNPRVVLVLAAAVVVPYAAEAAGTGRSVVLLAPLAGFLAGLPLLTGLRVLERTSSLTRLLPFATPVARAASVVVPGVCFLAFGLACAPVVTAAIHAELAAALLLGIAVGASSASSAVRWVTGRPPDYSRPMVSTPAGGVPTNLYGSALRGFDILVLTSAPLLLVSDHVVAAEVSLGLSALVLSVLLGRPSR